jgi:hypothetical protein
MMPGDQPQANMNAIQEIVEAASKSRTMRKDNIEAK